MSLVERALQKLQAARPAHAAKSGVPTVPIAAQPSPAVPAARSNEPWRSPADLRSGGRKLMHVDRERLRSLGMLPAATQEREVGDQFRVVKRPLIAFATGERDAAESSTRSTIMVASALPGDGKTFTSLNLALSLALEREMPVLLVDADVPKPHLTGTFGLDGAPGLLDAIIDPNRAIHDEIVPTDVPRLDFLPAGTLRSNATELLASARMRDVTERLASMYRGGIVVFDSPPILLTNEARVLAQIMGQIVLVVRAGGTPQQAVRDAVEVLGEDRRVSLILNQADLKGAMGYYYGQRYGYGQGYAGSGPTAEPARGAGEQHR